MTQLNLFPQEHRGDIYWNAAESSGSALREFYETHDYNAYTRFAKSCQVFARESGYPFVEAAQRIHNMFNIKAGNR